METNRRNFLKTIATATAGSVIAPYILPTGRLFAASGDRIANHVVFCLFAGGVRRNESVDKERGNLMPYSLSGTETISGNIIGGLDPIPTLSTSTLQQQGTLFKNFRYQSQHTGHFSGHTTAITGRYSDAYLDIRQAPQYPTVFEYYRKHQTPNPSAKNCWWVANVSGSYGLNFSTHPNYGPMYGANFLQPNTIIAEGKGIGVLDNPIEFSGDNLNSIYELRNLFNNTFRSQASIMQDAIENEVQDQLFIQQFIKQSIISHASGGYGNMWDTGDYANYDTFNMYLASQVLQTFQPELLVVNMQAVDTCHSKFTDYCNNLRKADYALAKLWQTIQSTPGLANDTILIVAPEHGRNALPNSLVDSFGESAYDHSDDYSREIFCLVVGPPDKVRQNQIITQTTGESIDIVPTIARVLGFHTDIPAGILNGRHLQEAFV